MIENYDKDDMVRRDPVAFKETDWSLISVTKCCIGFGKAYEVLERNAQEGQEIIEQGRVGMIVMDIEKTKDVHSITFFFLIVDFYFLFS